LESNQAQLNEQHGFPLILRSNGNLLAGADANNTITRYYVHGAGLLAAITPSDEVYCYHYDGVGNTVAITDSSETVVNSYDYSPFGMIISESEGFAQPFKFVGKLGVMAEGDFYSMRARYYGPRTVPGTPYTISVNQKIYGQMIPSMIGRFI
jgi:YD repeat-containing protein